MQNDISIKINVFIIASGINGMMQDLFHRTDDLMHGIEYEQTRKNANVLYWQNMQGEHNIR